MRKMIMRIDDVGFTDVCNIGSFETIERGIATSADVMLDTPGAEDALRRLKDFSWISVGWHTHMWGAPVLGAAAVPSLVEKEGPFEGRFRADLSMAADVDPTEAIDELREQMRLCVGILGRAPDTCGMFGGDTPWRRALAEVVKENGIAHDFAFKQGYGEKVLAKIRAAQENREPWALQYRTDMPDRHPAPEWADRNIFIADSGPAYMDLFTDSVTDVEEKYDPVLYYTEDRGGFFTLPEGTIFEQSWHPGYLDYYVYRLGERMLRERARQFTVARVQDVEALCSDRLRDWVRENRVELVNFRDALYGTREYQNHLRQIGSDLYMG